MMTVRVMYMVGRQSSRVQSYRTALLWRVTVRRSSLYAAVMADMAVAIAMRRRMIVAVAAIAIAVTVAVAACAGVGW